jgi:hypothetical protein
MWSYLVVLLKSDLDVQKASVAGSPNKSLRLASALCVTTLITVTDIILVTLCCAT